MRQLTSLDAQFLAFENARNYGHVSGLAILDPASAPGGTFLLEDMLALLAGRLHLLPPFRWRLAPIPLGLGHPFWFDDAEFDLEYHVRELALPPPGDDVQLAEQAGRLHSRPLDRSRPLWECYVIQGLSDGRVGVFTKIHHAAIDGLSGAEILSVLLDVSPAGREIAPAGVEATPEPVPGPWELLARGLTGLPRQGLGALGSLPRLASNLDSVPGVGMLPGAAAVSALGRRVTGNTDDGHGDGGVLESPAIRPPRTIFNGPLSPHRRIAFGTMSLTAVKAIKNHLGMTVNDVYVALCAGAVRRWLLARGELPDEPLVAQIPVSVRTPEQFGTYGNRISMMAVPIPTNEPDALRRVELAHEAMSSAKDRHSAVPASILQDATRFIPPAVFARASRATLALSAATRVAPWNLVLSNVPGSPVPLYMGGATLVANYPISAIVDGVGLNITVLSYLDRLDFGVVGDRVQMGEAWPLMDDLRASLEELTALVE